MLWLDERSQCSSDSTGLERSLLLSSELCTGAIAGAGLDFAAHVRAFLIPKQPGQSNGLLGKTFVRRYDNWPYLHLQPLAFHSPAGEMCSRSSGLCTKDVFLLMTKNSVSCVASTVVLRSSARRESTSCWNCTTSVVHLSSESAMAGTAADAAEGADCVRSGGLMLAASLCCIARGACWMYLRMADEAHLPTSCMM